MGRKWHSTLVGFRSKTNNLSLVIPEKHKTHPNEGHSTKFLISAPQNHQGQQDQGKSEQFSEPKGAYGDTVTKSNVVFQMGS